MDQQNQIQAQDPEAREKLDHHHHILHKLVHALKEAGIFTAEAAANILAPGVPK